MIEIPVSGGRAVALIDDADLELVSQHTWTLHESKQGNQYARCQLSHGRGYRNPCRLLMHVLIFGATHVDHADRNGLNNQHTNLRDASMTQNQANQRAVRGGTSLFKGVAWSGCNWRADIRVARQRRYLGSFSTEEEAARAYDGAAVEAFGEFAATNQALGLLSAQAVPAAAEV